MQKFYNHIYDQLKTNKKIFLVMDDTNTKKDYFNYGGRSEEGH